MKTVKEKNKYKERKQYKNKSKRRAHVGRGQKSGDVHVCVGDEHMGGEWQDKCADTKRGDKHVAARRRDEHGGGVFFFLEETRMGGGKDIKGQRRNYCNVFKI